MSDITQHIRYEKLLKEFHPTKNVDIKLSDFSYGSRKKVWWKCDVASDHEWEAEIRERYKETNCPCCAGLKVVSSNCLSTTNPDLTKEWHPTKNKSITPFDITKGSGKKVWWKCVVAEDHEWQDTIIHRTSKTNKRGCFCCSGKKLVNSNCFAVTHPELSKEWHSTKNGNLTPFDVTFGSSKEIWWQCKKFNSHIWKAPLNRRTSRNSGCPFCNESHGENKIRIFLEENDIKYEIQKSFNDCKLKQLLLFDFYLPTNNILIEFDGQQHFEPVKIFGGIKKFKETQKRDKIKNKFAEENNIKLLRIPYTEFENVNEILFLNLQK